MNGDLFAEYFSHAFVPPNQAPPVASPMAGLTTMHHDDGTRTLRHGETVLGHYERQGARAGWRGVTDGGAVVRAATETGVRRALVEASL